MQYYVRYVVPWIYHHVQYLWPWAFIIPLEGQLTFVCSFCYDSGVSSLVPNLVDSFRDDVTIPSSRFRRFTKSP